MKLFQDLLPTFWGNDYQPLAGGKIYVYANGADETLCKLYSSSAGGDTALENPLPLNSAGRTDTPVYIDSDGAFAVVEDGNGVKVKEFVIEPENRIASGEAVYLKNSSELSQIKNPANGQYAEVREPAPCRLYRFAAGSAAAADGVLAISGVGGAWHLVAQSNWVYSSWWQGNDFATFVNAANSYSYDMAVNSKLNNASDKNLNGKLKLMSGSQINTSGSANIYCRAGFETAPNATTGGNVRFELLGGSYDAWQLQGKRIVGHVDRLFLNANYEINQNDVLFVHTLDGNANCSLTVYGRLHLFDTGRQNPAYKIITESQEPNSVKVFLEGIVFAKIFQHSTDWSHIMSSDLGGLEFYSGDGEYTFTEVRMANNAPQGYGILSGTFKIASSSTVIPAFARIYASAAIENNSSSAACQVPDGIKLNSLSGSGKFRFNISKHHNEYFTGNFDAASTFATFESCRFKNELTISSSGNMTFSNCTFDNNIALTRNNYEQLRIIDCEFLNDARIVVNEDVNFSRCDICRNWSGDNFYKSLNASEDGALFTLVKNYGNLSVWTNLIFLTSFAGKNWKGNLLIETKTTVGSIHEYSFNPSRYAVTVSKGANGKVDLEIVPSNGSLNYANFIPGGTGVSW